MKAKNMLLLAFAMAAASLCAETYWLDTSVSYNGKPYPNPMTNAYNWIAADGVTRAGAAGAAIPYDGIFYLRGKATLGNEGKVRLQTTSNYTFAELHVGDLAHSRSGQLLVYKADVTHTFNGVTYLESGSYTCNKGHGNTYTYFGDFRVKSPDSAPFLVSAGYTNCTLIIKGSLSSEAGCTLKMGGNNPYNKCDPDRSLYRLDADMSGFGGTLWLYNDDTEPRTDSMTPQTLRFDSSVEMEGSLAADHDTALVLAAESTSVQVGNISLGANTLLKFTATDAGTSILIATNAFSHSGKIYVALDITHGQSVGTVTHTLLTVPVANAFCLDDFECTAVPANSDVPFTEGFSVVTNETVGTCSLVYSYCYLPEGAVYLNPGDSSAKDNNREAHYSSSLTNAAHWSDGHVPEAGKDYFVRSVDGSVRALRSLQRDWTDEAGHTARDYTFAGDSLSIARGGMLILCADKMRFNKLRLYDGAVVHCVNVSPPSTKYLSGSIEFASGTVYLREFVNHTLRLEGTVSGSGEICLDGANPTGSPKGNYSFASADMTAFKGRIRVSNNKGNKSPDFLTTNQFFHVTAESQLGGKLDAFDPAALMLERCGTLLAEASFTFTTNNNRGLTVSGAGRVTVTSAGHVLTIQTPIAATGILRKDGPGTLRLGGALTAGETAGVENVFELYLGKLRLAHAEAMNGMTLAVSNETSIVLEMDPSDPALAAKGVRMEKSATPFALAEGLDGLPLTFEAAGAAPADGNPFTHGILTVANDADVVASVRSMLPPMAGRVFRGYSQELVETEDAEAGTHTFALRFKKRGLVFSVR